LGDATRKTYWDNASELKIKVKVSNSTATIGQVGFQITGVVADGKIRSHEELILKTDAGVNLGEKDGCCYVIYGENHWYAIAGTPRQLQC